MFVGITYIVCVAVALYFFFRLFTGPKNSRLLAIWTVLTPFIIGFATIMGCLVMFFYVDGSYWKDLEASLLTVHTPEVGDKLYMALYFPFKVVLYLAKLWAVLMFQYVSIPLIIFHVWVPVVFFKLARVSFHVFGHRRPAAT